MDDLLTAMTIAGIGLSIAYLRAEFVLRRECKVKERKKGVVQRELHANGLRLEQKHDITNPSVFPQPRIREPPGLSDGPIVYSREPDSGQMVSQRRDVCMTSKSTRKFKISGALRILGAFFAIAVLTGCAPNIGDIGPCAVCFGPPTQVNLEGTLSGLVGSRLQLQNNGAGGVQLDGTASNGTSVAFASAPFNTAYNLTVQTQPTNPSQTCLVANGTGTAGTTDITDIVVTCTTNSPRFAYVTNGGSNNVSAYTVDPTTGSLTTITGSPFAAGNLPVAIAVDPTGTYAYVANQTDATISAFAVDRTSGVLTQISGSPFTTGPSPTSVAIDPSSSFLYVTNSGAGTVSAYAIAVGSGALTAVSGSPFATGGSPSSVAVDPVRLDVYVANESDGTVSVFSIDNGALSTNGSPFSAGNSPRALTIDPSGPYIYIANASANTISALSNGTAIAGSPYTTGSIAYSVAFDPSGKFLYVANQGTDNISAFAVKNATGALTDLVGSPFATGMQPSFVTVDPTGAFAYVANTGSNTVSVYAIDATRGALTAIGGSPFVTGTQPLAIAISD
jgi:6-phosphogluconolactonase